MQGVSKRYGGVRALQDADLAIEAGRIHAVLGENGAGKSTLIKIMAGVVAPDEGRMLLDGEPVSFASPAAANAAGIACIFQELSLIPDLSVADNIAISNPPRRFGLIDRRAQRRMAEEALARAGADNIHPLALVKDLSLSRRQMVEIAKALARKPRILILDEATSALTAADVTKIYGVLKRLRAEGLALVYISHRMHEITELADECTVFCNGRSVASFAAGTKTDNEVVELMIGREYNAVFPARDARARRATRRRVLEVRHLGWTDRLNDISLQLHAGEVIGLGGLDGQGQRELLLALFGVLRGTTGEVLIDGRPVAITGPHVAKRKEIGMALIPEDRKTEGLMLPMSVRDNLSFAALDTLVALGRRRRGGRTRRGRADRAAARGAHRRHRPAGRLAFRRQPAEARHRQVADDGAAHPAAERSDARHRRRHQAGDVPAAARAGRRGRGDPLLLDRLRRAHRLLRPRARDVRRRDQARAGRRRDHRTRADQQRLEHRRRSAKAGTRAGGARRERRLALLAARAQGHAARLRRRSS